MHVSKIQRPNNPAPLQKDRSGQLEMRKWTKARLTY